MPRKPRFYLSGVSVHVVQRGNNRQAVFDEDHDYQAYLNWLQEGLARYDGALHAYVLMTNHVHLLMTPNKEDAIIRVMQYVGRRYVSYVNHKYGRTGTLWEGRYKGSLVQDEQYLLTCMRYIELNPVRANMVKSPAHYRWSSYRFNAQGRASGLVTPHERYLALGSDSQVRQAAYRGLFKTHLDAELINDIRLAWQTGTPLGNDRFRRQIERALKTKVGHSKRGRPRKPYANIGKEKEKQPSLLNRSMAPGPFVDIMPAKRNS